MSLPIENARERLIRIGKEELLRDGYYSMRIQNLTAECGMAAGTFYSYFKSKSDFAIAIVQNDWDLMLEKIDAEVPEKTDFRGKIATVFEIYRDFTDTYFNCFMQFAAEKKNATQFVAIKERCLQQMSDRIVRLILRNARVAMKVQIPENEIGIMIVANMFTLARNSNLSPQHYETMLEDWLFPAEEKSAQEYERMRFQQEIQEIFSANPEALCHFTLNLSGNRCYEGQGKSPELIQTIHSETADGLFQNIAGMIPELWQRKEFETVFSREKLISSFEAGTDSASMTYDRISPQGELRAVDTSIRMIKNPETGDITGALYTVDTTQQKRLHEVLGIMTNQEHQMVLLLDLKTGMLEAIYLGLGMPEAYRKYFHKSGDVCSAEDMKQYSLETWLFPEDRKKYLEETDMAHLPDKLNRFGHVEFTVRACLSADRRELSFRKFQQYWLNDRHQQVLIVTSDVTESMRHQQEELEKERKLRKAAASANQAKTDFLSRISHDIRTPMNGIIGMTHIAKTENNPEKTRDCLNKIETSSKFLLGLVNEILDLSKTESEKAELHAEPYPIAAFRGYIDAVIRPLCTEKHQKLEIETRLISTIIPLKDILKINQIYFNLLSNAVKYTPEGGTITVKTRETMAGPGRVRVEAAVSDNGLGISEKFQKILFEPFTQENRNDVSDNRGSGLGLAIVKRNIDALGGTISVRSKPGEGTTFLFEATYDCIPIEKYIRQKFAADQFDADRLKGKHILVCEDHPMNQEIITDILKEKGMMAQIAGNGAEGVKCFAGSSVGYFHAVLMDIRMPVMDGYEAAKAIRALERPDAESVPIIALTADVFAEDEPRCIRAGMNGRLAKPIIPQDLYKALSAVL